VFLQSLESGCGSFVKTSLVFPDGLEVAIDSELSTRPVRHDRQGIN